MPQVPVYQQDSVAQRPVSGARNEGLSAEAFGAGVGRGLGALAGGVDDAAKAAAAQQDMQDHTAAKALDTQYAAHDNATLWGPDGLMGKTGRAFLLAQPDAEKALREKARDLAAQAQSPQQRQMFKDVVDQRLEQSLSSIAHYATTAQRDDYLATSSARLSNQAENAIASYADPKTFKAQFTTGLAELADLADHMGWSPDTYASKRLEYSSGVHAGVVENMMTAGMIPEARAYVEQNAAQMDARTAVGLKGRLRELSALYGANAATNAVLGMGVTPTQGGPLPTGAEAQRVTSIVKAEGGSDADVRTLIAMDMLESGGTATPRSNGSSTGKFQFHPDTFAQVAKPGEDIHNPDHSTAAAYRLMKVHERALAGTLGRDAQPWELYLAHQQGIGGAKALLGAPPEVSAIAALTPAYVKQYGSRAEAVAREAVVKNGGTESSTVGDFLDLWRGKMNRRLNAAGGAAPTSELPDREAFVQQVVATAPDHDPRTLATYRSQAEAKWADLKAAKTDHEQRAVDQAQVFLRDPGVRTIAEFQAKAGPALWGALPETTKTSITDHYGSGGYAKDSDPVALAGLQQMQASNPKGFTALDLTKYVGQLDSGDYGKMLEDQKTMRLGGGAAKEHEVTVSRVMGITGAMLKSVGIEPSGKKQGDAKKVAAFQVQIMKAVQYFQQANPGKPVTDTDVQRMADTLLLHGSWNEGSLFSRQGLRFEAPNGKPFTYDVPPKAKREIIEAYAKRNGRQPTSAQVQADYRRFRAAGIYH